MSRIPRSRSGLITGVLLLCASAASAQTNSIERAPSVPLITHDPYFSVWSAADRPTDDWSRHWTGAIHAMSGMVRVDGTTYRVLGPEPSTAKPMELKGLQVRPTRTIYRFEGGGVALTLTFTSPLLVKDLEVLARPASYITWDAKAIDGRDHAVSVYFDATGEWAVNTPDQAVVWSREQVEGLDSLRIGTASQEVLKRVGDNVRIDWGHLLIAAPKSEKTTSVVASDRETRGKFNELGTIPTTLDTRMPRAARDSWPVLAFRTDLGTVGKEAKSTHLIVGYDAGYAIEYFGKKLRPYWRKEGRDASWLLTTAEKDYEKLVRRCQEFDDELTADLTRVGGADYARLAALSYRQCLAAHGIARTDDGKPIMLSKENFSNGCIGTVDVTYPAAPFFLLFSPELLKAQIGPILDYAGTARWKFPFAPHDLGTYPLANGQVYGGGEKTEQDQMPVEECGNMLILVAALAKSEGNAEYARTYWPVLTKWADYLKDKGLDPENQLCTDDFAGHLAHNTNLSLKAIVAIGGYAQLAETLGKTDAAKSYRDAAREMAKKWGEMAGDGDHYRLAFDKPGTWSQKYNLVWDKLLGLDLFPAEIARKEIAFALKAQKEFGLPLDNRSLYTKLDWIVWTATMAENRADFEALIRPLIRFVDRSPSRVPLTDWYWTSDAKQQGFQARSVVGGVFIKMLTDPTSVRKWSKSN